MKTTLVILLLSFGSLSGYSQTIYGDPTVTQVYANPNPMYATPNQTPSCYKYINNNHEIIKCPGRNGELNISGEDVYMGNYPTTKPEDLVPLLKNDGTKIWLRPAYDEAYTIVQDPPCYIYKRHNLPVMECPGIKFEPVK